MAGLAIADQAAVLRETVRATGERLGRRVSFAPLIEAGGIGNGVHVHLSFRDAAGAPATYDPAGPQGMSTATDGFVAGVLAHLPAILAFLAPSVISYGRLVPHRWSAAFDNLGVQDREAAVRICPVRRLGGGDVAAQFHFEVRACDAAASPHLALAALVHAGAAGIEAGLAAPEATAEDLSLLPAEALRARGHRRLPASLGAALDALEASEEVRGLVSRRLRGDLPRPQAQGDGEPRGAGRGGGGPRLSIGLLTRLSKLIITPVPLGSSTRMDKSSSGEKAMNMSKAALAAVLAAVLSAAPVAAQDDPIVFGGALCLTGVQAPLDTPGFRGAQVAVKALNDAGGLLGRQVEFINIDGKSDPVTVGNAAVELIDQGADLILAPCDFDFGGPASREAQTAGLVGLSLCASDPLYSSWSLGDKQFTLSMWNTTMGATAAEYAFKERGWKTAYVVTDQFIAYTKSLSKYFIEHFKALGGEILLEDTYTNGDNNFSAQLARLQALDKKPDVIFVSSYGQDIGAIIRALREVGYDAPVMGGDAYDDPAMIASLGPTLGNDIYFVTHTWMGAEALARHAEVHRPLHGDVRRAARHRLRRHRLGRGDDAGAGGHGGRLDRRRGGGQGAGGRAVQAPDRRSRLPQRRGGPRARQVGGAGRGQGRQADLRRLAHPGKHAAGLILPDSPGRRRWSRRRSRSSSRGCARSTGCRCRCRRARSSG